MTKEAEKKAILAESYYKQGDMAVDKIALDRQLKAQPGRVRGLNACLAACLKKALHIGFVEFNSGRRLHDGVGAVGSADERLGVWWCQTVGQSKNIAVVFHRLADPELKRVQLVSPHI